MGRLRFQLRLPPRRQLTALVAAAGFLSLIGFAAFRSQISDPADGARAEVQARHLPNIRMWDHDGNARSFYDDLVRGKVVAINFTYTACSRMCTLATQNLALLQDLLTDELGQSVAIYSITIDPEHDTPEVLRRHREAIGARHGWTFFTTGTRESADKLRRSLGVADPDPETDADYATHTGMLIIGSELDARWTMVPSLLDPRRLRQAIERVALPPSLRAKGQEVISAVARSNSDASLVADRR